MKSPGWRGCGKVEEKGEEAGRVERRRGGRVVVWRRKGGCGGMGRGGVVVEGVEVGGMWVGVEGR